ncbi:hypothetical protein K9U39_04045 [Rhodoblastus acidophilus]|uniref:Surface antigen domain-containing protein n=1 Tax=Candidatus Rhodoblastus alkanivorans TaxID=2954117 RepID=A0ABS9Z6J5_9HYPH|nr:hypothetical protein [Candidatus Rhodoblastus alkanivorans]MCI4680532.1 hypothetical protein [Candidatus Rhodoblastus alkanivorans]MCI4682817.1 hypothetical protein [Candidatus Rhodoblastus alkanivorans]MDI4640126.1 hypothetical protein [Rhodoblastus acidophilus]
MKILARAGAASAMMLLLGGCATQLGGAPPPAAATSAPLPGPYAGLADGLLGASLDAADKTAANNAEIAALNSGDRKTWRGDDGTYGYVAPGAANGDCRDFTHTVYFNGRPKVGKGTACKADGGWKLKA